MKTITLNKAETEDYSRGELLEELRIKFPELELTNVAFNPGWPINEPCWAYGTKGNLQIVWEEYLEAVKAKKELS